jgi:hypothetical protein
MFLLDDGPQIKPNYERFVRSLSIEQVAFLIVALKGSTSRKYFALRNALDLRMANHHPKEGLGHRVIEFFYDQPQAHTNGKKPRRDRFKELGHDPLGAIKMLAEHWPAPPDEDIWADEDDVWT